MMRNVFLFVGAALFSTSAAFAGGDGCQGGAHAAKDGAKTVACASGGATAGCTGAKATACKAGAPCMKYEVGDKSTCCPDEAAKLAGGDKSKIVYVVGENKFNNEGEAQVALATAIDTYVNDLVTVKFAVGETCVPCPMEAASLAKKEGKEVHYRLATFDFASKEAAETAAKNAKEAADGVKLSWKVGEKSYCCSSMAGDAAKKEGKPVEYCVGEKTSPCETTAKVEMAQARLMAAIMAIEKAQQG